MNVIDVPNFFTEQGLSLVFSQHASTRMLIVALLGDVGCPNLPYRVSTMPLLLEDVFVNEDKMNWLISLSNGNFILKAFLLILFCFGFFFPCV